jgi:hypothetical protein
MKSEQIKLIKIGTVLTWIPTGEKFVVVGLNEKDIAEGSAVKVTGMECDALGQYSSESMPSVFSLSNSKFN